MPTIATFHNTIFNIRCSKCKRTQENHYFQSNGRVYKTCNGCRDRDARRRMCPVFLASLNPPPMGATRHIPSDTSDDDDSVHHPNAVSSLIGLGFNYVDADTAAVLLLSSSAAAASSSSSAGYFVDEPDPEPEPEGP